MYLHIISDTHLEFRNNINYVIKCIKNNADYLALLGDICMCGSDKEFIKYKNFITILSKKFKKIFIVTGNHEYYTEKNLKKKESIQDINIKINNFCKTIKNVIFLNNKSYRLKRKNLKDIVFFGTTLWTSIPKDKLIAVESNMNDYSNIYYKNKNKINNKLKALDVVQMNKKMVASIKSLITRCKKKNEECIILTHHKPYQIGEFKNVIDYAYSNKLNNIIKKPIIIWSYGHTHKSDNRIINKVKIYSNPMGYPHENHKITYDNKLKIKI